MNCKDLLSSLLKDAMAISLNDALSVLELQSCEDMAAVRRAYRRKILEEGHCGMKS